MLDCKPGILDCGDALDHHWQVVALLELVDLRPVEPRLEPALLDRTPRGGAVALGDVALAPRQRDAAARLVDADGERPPRTQKIAANVGHAHITVPTAITLPTGRSAGSLHVSAVSPFRAAGLLLTITVGLPVMMVPLFVGGF